MKISHKLGGSLCFWACMVLVVLFFRLKGFLISLPCFYDFGWLSKFNAFFLRFFWCFSCQCFFLKIMIGVLISFICDVDRLSYLKVICFWHLSSKANLREFQKKHTF